MHAAANQRESMLELVISLPGAFEGGGWGGGCQRGQGTATVCALVLVRPAWVQSFCRVATEASYSPATWVLMKSQTPVLK